MLKLYRYLLLIISFNLSPSILFATEEITQTIDDGTHFITWKLNDGNFQLELVQRSPQQTRSFFQGRGFTPTIANDIATHCVFQTIIRNTQAHNQTDSITVSLKDWRLISSDDLKPKTPTKTLPRPLRSLKLKKQWDDQWDKDTVNAAARIAFRWATFPTEQTFEPNGDFNWGMITFGLKPDTQFDLHVFWEQNGQKRDAWIKQLSCPADTSD